MRRAIAAAVMGGLLLGGAVATPSVAAVGGGGKAAPTKARPSKAATAMKTVAYAGYEFQVPASWPVYRLDEHPNTCVRYDVHAVYLGKPGTDMRCAAGLVGRTQTVSLIPGRGVTAGSGTPHQGHSAAQKEPAGTELQRLSAVHGTITQNAVDHELKVALGTAAPAATVLGTYGTDPAVVEQVLYTLRLAPPGTVPTRPVRAGVVGNEADVHQLARSSRQLAGRDRSAVPLALALALAAVATEALAAAVPPGERLRHLHRPVDVNDAHLAQRLCRHRRLHRRGERGLRRR